MGYISRLSAVCCCNPSLLRDATAFLQPEACWSHCRGHCNHQLSDQKHNLCLCRSSLQIIDCGRYTDFNQVCTLTLRTVEPEAKVGSPTCYRRPHRKPGSNRHQQRDELAIFENRLRVPEVWAVGF